MMRERPLIAVYMMANKLNGTLYVGVTSNLYQRVHEHREGLIPGFTQRYGLKRLVWYESIERMTQALRREHTLKGWPRDWKINLIERENPLWNDLYPGLMNDPEEQRY
jgi:putative endonuclease